MANLLSNTTIGGYQSIHTGNIGSYAITSLSGYATQSWVQSQGYVTGSYLPLSGGTVSGVTNFSSTVNMQATSWFGGYGPGSGPGIALENIASFARFAFWGLDFYDWNHGIQMTIDNNYVSATNSFRAPIFYDSNDTNYYGDFAGTSNLYNLSLTGAKNTYLQINPGNGYEAMVRYIGGSGSSWYVGKRLANDLVNTASFHFFSEAAGVTVAGIDTGGNFFTTGYLTIAGTQLTGTQTQLLKNTLDVTTLPYKCDIYVEGDGNTFYPVHFMYGDQDVWRRIIIKRGYYEDAPWDPIGTGVHHGGLLLDWEGNFGGWGGAEYADRIRVFNQSYTDVCADMYIYTHSMGYVFMLRGGHAIYHIYSDQPINGYYQSGAPDIAYSTSTKFYNGGPSYPQYDVYAPAPLTLAQTNPTRIDGLRTKKQSLLDSRYLRQGVDISGISYITSTNFLATNAFYLNSYNYYLNATDGGFYSNVQISSATQMKAPIYYDLNDTTYYGDFAGTSNLNFLNLGNTREEFPFIRMGSAGRYAIGVSGAHTRISAHHQGSGVQLGSYDGTTFTPKLTVGNDGNVEAVTSFKAPIFYDSADTSYYVDPNGLSVLSHIRLNNNWSNATPNDGAINIRGQYPSMTFRNTVSDSMWLRHMDGSGDIQHYYASDGVDSVNWGIKHSMFKNGNFYSLGTHTASQFNGSGAGLTGTASSLSVGYATTAGALSSMNISQFTNNSGYLTGITSGQVTGALGYTPYNSSNPSGYITSGDTTTGIFTTFLGNGTSNIGSGYTRVIRNENGAGGAPNYAPILHIAASDTMWQIAGAHAGQTTLVWRSGYSGAWNTPWWTIYHSGNFTDNSSNWNTAYSWGNHASAGYQPLENQRLSTGNSPTFAEIYNNGWFRNNNTNTGLFNQANGNHFYSRSGTQWAITSNGSTLGSLSFYRNHESVLEGLVYFDTDGFGLLNRNGSWAVRSDRDNNSVRLYYNAGERLRTDNQGAYVTGRLDVSNYIYTPQHIVAKNIQGTYQVLNLDTPKEPGLYQYDGGIGGTQPAGTNWYNVKTIEIGVDGRYSQFVMPYSNNRVFYRSQVGATWLSYAEVITSENIGSQSVSYATTAGALSSMNISQFTNNSGYITSSSLSSYLPLSGGTMSGGIAMGGNNITNVNQLSHSNGRIILSGNLHIDSFNGYAIYLQYYNQGVTTRIYGDIDMNNYNTTNVNIGYANSSFRAPIFYDSQDTNYYVDPNGMSKQVQLTNLGTYGSNAANARNHFVQYNAGNAGIAGGWIAAAFGDATAARVVIGQSGSITEAIIGSHNGNLTDWGALGYVATTHKFYAPSWTSAVQLEVNTNGVYAPAYRGNANVGGTGSASWHPDGIYCGSTMWQYGSLYKNGSGIYDVGQLKLNAGPYIEVYNSRNTIFRSADNADAGILGRGSANQFAFQIYGSGGDYGFLDGAWANWDIRKTVDGAMYMNDNNSYYLQTNSTSNFYALNIQGSAVVHAGNIGSQSVSYATTAGSADQIDGWGFVNTGSNNATNADTINSNGISYVAGGISLLGQTDGALYSQRYSDSWQHQIYGDYRTGQIVVRGKNSGSWQAWRTVLDSGNYNSYSPTLTGGNASGTWSINVTGSAGSISGFNNPATGATANTIVYRDAGGDIYSRYAFAIHFNASCPNNENPAIAAIWTNSAADNYLRKSTPAHLISQLGLITSSSIGSQSVSYASSAGSVAWTNVSSRPTALSQFSNDLGNYGGWLTTGGKAADSELLDGTDSIYFVKGNGVNALGYRTTGNSGANSAGGLSSGFYDGSGMSNMPTSDWYHLIVNAHNNSSTSNQYEFQLATAFWDKSNFYVRSISPGDVGPWRTLVHNGNIGSQSVNYANSAGSASTAGSATSASQLTKYGDIYGDNWNTYYVGGKLIVSTALGMSGANKPPTSYEYGVALSYGESGGPLLQMYFPENSGNIGTIFRKGTYRTGWNGNWSTWKTLVEQEGNLCTIVGGNAMGLEVHGNVGYNQDPLTYFLLRGQADTSWKAFKVRLTGDAGGQDIEFRRIAENGTDSRMWYVPRGVNTVNFDYPIVQPSDSRLKDNITPISTPVDKIKSLRGVEFDWNSGEQVGTHDIGLIAQDVEAVLPEAVTTQEDGYKNLAYTKVIPLLVEAMKEQQKMIEALRAEIDLLKTK